MPDPAMTCMLSVLRHLLHQDQPKCRFVHKYMLCWQKFPYSISLLPQLPPCPCKVMVAPPSDCACSGAQAWAAHEPGLFR